MHTLRENQASKAQRVFPALEAATPVETRGWNGLAGSLSGKPRSKHGAQLTTCSLTATTLSIHNLHLHGPLFTNYLRARRDVFILSKGWKLPEVDGMEFDQYDTPKARWIVAHDGDVVKGGVRIAPTTAQCGLHSYMIRDAQLGLLDGLPLDPLYFEAPVADHLWEGTRFFVAESVPAKERGEVQRMLLTDMAAAASAEGVRHVIGIVPAVFKRWMNRIGMDAYAVGPKFVLDGETSQAAMMNLTSIRASTEAAAAVQMPRAERAREFLNETFRRVAATL